MTKSQKDIIFKKLRAICKEFFFRNNLGKLSCKNPVDMSITELLTFVEIQGLSSELAQIQNDVVLKISEIESAIVQKIPKDVKDILTRLENNSLNSFIVGGAIRDSALSKEPKDWDFVTDLSYKELQTIFGDCKFKETGKEFLVFNLNYNCQDYEIANFRTDVYTEGELQVRIGTLEEDQARRDFYINSIFWNSDGLVISSEALDDISTKTLRFIGNPEDRLAEDYLRGIRFYRIIAQKGLKPDKESLKAVRRLFEKVISSNPHRIMMEIEKICLI